MLYFRRENWENIFENVYEESAETLRMGEIFFFSQREQREEKQEAENHILMDLYAQKNVRIFAQTQYEQIRFRTQLQLPEGLLGKVFTCWCKKIQHRDCQPVEGHVLPTLEQEVQMFWTIRRKENAMPSMTLKQGV